MEAPVIESARSRFAGPQPGKDAASFLRNSPGNNEFHQCVSQRWAN